MTTIKVLAEELSRCLGINERAVLWTVNDLHEAGRLPALEQAAGFIDAARLLIALAGMIDLSRPIKALEQFEGLPFIDARQENMTDRGTFESAYLATTSDLVIAARGSAGFGDFLASILTVYCAVERVATELGIVILGHERGQTFATLSLGPPRDFWAPGRPAGAMVRFGTGETKPPDDATICRLQRCTVIPETIFPELRRILTGKAEPPRFAPEVSDADAAEHERFLSEIESRMFRESS